MLSRAQVVQNGNECRASAGIRTLAGVVVTQDATAGNITWTAASVMGGYLIRTGPGAGYGDTTPSADQLVAAYPELTRGDSFTFLCSSGVAFANTVVAGAGITLAGTSGVAASSVREYLVTLLSGGNRTRVAVGSTTNASAVISNLSATDIQNISVGMLATGTGVGAAPNAVLAVNLSNNTVTLAVVSSATADNIAVTFTPNFEFRGMRTSTN